LKSKGQRTVARLTIVKGWNSDEIAGYAKLIALGHCSLVEVKGVTFCGKSDASNLNMSNTPWHHEVIGLVRNLQEDLQKIRDETPEGKKRSLNMGLLVSISIPSVFFWRGLINLQLTIPRLASVDGEHGLIMRSFSD